MARNWLVFWVILALLGVAAILIPIVYNLQLQLTPNQLEAARERWRQQGTLDYELLSLIRHDDDRTGEELHVWVQGGDVVQVVQNDSPLLFHPAMAVVLGGVAKDLPQRDFSGQTVEGLFHQIEDHLRDDAAREGSGKRNYATATFDPRDGHPVRYVHRVSGTKERREWQIKLIRK